MTKTNSQCATKNKSKEQPASCGRSIIGKLYTPAKFLTVNELDDTDAVLRSFFLDKNFKF